MSVDEKIQKVFRCEKCNLVPLINYYLDESEENIIEQKVSIKCRNNHLFNNIDFDVFLSSYIKEENEKNIDSICQQHNKKIDKICKKCELNLCSKCKHDCREIIKIKELELSEKEKDKIKKNLDNFAPFFEKLKSLIDFKSYGYKSYFEKNKKLLSFAEIIYSTYLKYEKENCLSFEIIRNCRFCLKFKYKELSLFNDRMNVIRSRKLPLEVEMFLTLAHSNGYESRKIILYLKPKNYIIMPSNNIDISKYKLLTDYEIEIKEIKDNYFSSFAEFLDDKFAMVEKENINIYKNDSLKIIHTIKIDINVAENDYNCYNKITSIFCMQNGNLLVSTYDKKIYIYRSLELLFIYFVKDIILILLICLFLFSFINISFFIYSL